MFTAFVTAIPLPRITTKRATTSLSVRMSENHSEESQTPPEKPPSAPSKPQKTIRSRASFRNEYLEDFGRKGPGSIPPWDLRPKSIRTDSSDPEVCDSCRGTGIMTCTFCCGTSFYTEDGKALECPACKGEKVTCSVCFGSKKNIELEGNWWEKGVAALFRK